MGKRRKCIKSTEQWLPSAYSMRMTEVRYLQADISPGRRLPFVFVCGRPEVLCKRTKPSSPKDWKLGQIHLVILPLRLQHHYVMDI